MEFKFSKDDISFVVKKYILPQLDKYSVFAFTGPLGAGKTTLIREILIQSGVKENITSPTFNYVNTYDGLDGSVFNHFDLFRIESLGDFMQVGFDEFFYKINNYNFVEWPEVIKEFLNDEKMREKVLWISLAYVEGDFELRLLSM